ncbi:MAG: hypothetical protein EPN47_02310 [Acidobacteria bacterium]|nr:MAG: hypothetical protein EPN47_02310 [Acidobacteriota bacterium]
MISNHSVPTDTVLPHIFYPDVAEAIAWLEKSFGFREHYRYGSPDGSVNGAQMHLENAWIMLKQAQPGQSTPAQLGYGTQSLTVFVDGVDAHFERAKSVGARIVEDLHETEYGERQYGVVDFAGHHWLFSRHVRDVNPREWGAAISEPAVMAPQISPMLAVNDGNAAIDFYQAAFDATVLWRLGGSGHIVAGLSVHGARFFLATESPEYGTRGPDGAGFTTLRIELFVDDPLAVHRRAIAAGAIERSPVVEHRHATTGPSPITRMLQGSVVDPFGHMWLIGKFLE